ncbi:MAG: hypothetical protein CMK59_12575 [Proteobacteria bacterium]|nr:hypothetical protein [Pseudomonadota bacterium]
MFLLLIACSRDYNLDKIPEQQKSGDDSGSIPVEPTESPDIYIDPPVVDFGNVVKNCTSDPFLVTIGNEGLEDLIISDIEFAGEGISAFVENSDQFFQDGQLILPYGTSVPVNLMFSPEYFLDYEVELVVQSNDPDESSSEVPVYGHGASGPTIEEGFVQDYNPYVDVLWVVDNSCSMEPIVENMNDNFSAFINEFTSLNLDYHMSVVTTDMSASDQSGKIQGGIYTSAQNQNDVIQNFLQSSNVGTQGSVDEKGLDASKAALSEPLLSGHNAGFLRDTMNGEEVGLSVIVVSDENDYSSVNPNNYTSWILGLKNDPENVRFSSIVVSSSSSCDGVLEDVGERYIEVSENTNGFVADICTDNFDATLQEISLSAAGMTVSFPLQDTPFPLDAISVTVNGTEISQSITDGWTYDSRSNSIVFHGNAIPDAGESVVISYEVTGSCQ